jgi:hypothetical protein
VKLTVLERLELIYFSIVGAPYIAMASVAGIAAAAKYFGVIGYEIR